MINAIKTKVGLLAALLTTSIAVMAESVDVKVIGTITPMACKPTLAGGGTIDYGTINLDTLKRDEFTVLSEKQIDFSIVCNAPAKIALKTINGRTGSLAGNDEEISGYGRAPVKINSTYAAGLGLDASKKVGGYGISFSDATADNVKTENIYRQDDWAPGEWDLNHARGIFGNIDGLFSWGSINSPIAFTTLSGKLKVQAYINKHSELDLTKPVKLDGLTTLELVYL
ncbi:DUF1120 domain-containing protein [Enterobacter cloacae]|uniref:DUF1120 domain-containing protein n=1 Tax=Enterobacter cloacae TaxID=550 RepID=A0A3R9ALZ8_ENTCL|nr:DUF1120 domain-containing protein [Enterobacter cloacae]RSB24208.1 DUF1120 domain-containing protein [Enterobacter cloacae]